MGEVYGNNSMSDYEQDDASFAELGRQIHQHFEQVSGSLEEDSAVAPIMESLNRSRYRFDEAKPMMIGGAKRIYRVYDEHAGRWVVLAMPIEVKTLEEKEAFLREALLAAKLQHPAILPIYEMGVQSDGQPYFIMQLLEGTSLDELIKTADPRPDLDRWLSIFLRVCDAVVYAHACGVLHLDIKPENVMIGLHGRVYLIDWGMARVLRTGVQEGGDTFDPDLLNNVNYSGAWRGTLGFMAPEQIGSVREVGVATDVYGLGSLLYFILTHAPPIDGDSTAELLKKTKRGELNRPQQHRPELKIPTSLSAVAMKALALNPADRYADVDALRNDLIRYQNGCAPIAERAHIFKRGHLFVRRHHKVCFVLLLGSVLFLSMVLFFLARGAVLQDRTEQARLEAIENLALYQSETELTRQLDDHVQKFLIDSLEDGDIWNVDLMHLMVNRELNREDIDEDLRSKFYRYRAYLFFVQGAYHQALASFHEAGMMTLNNNLYKTCERFAEMKPDDAALLTPDAFAGLLGFSYRNSSLRKNLLTVCFREYMKRVDAISPEAYTAIVIGVLNVVNDSIGWGEQIQLERRGTGYHLDLSEAPYQILSLPKSTLIERAPYSEGFHVLLPLDLVSLDLSGSNIRDFEGIHFSEQFEKLSMQRMELYDLPASVFWLMQSGVKTLVIDQGLFKQDQNKKLQTVMEVSYTEE